MLLTCGMKPLINDLGPRYIIDIVTHDLMNGWGYSVLSLMYACGVQLCVMVW
jgi:hypothetical protein